VVKIGAALDAGNSEEARRLAHSIRGTGGSYGFARLSELGAVMESSAKAGDVDDVRRHLVELEDYLARVQISQ
jgi:HPt (histidine-containing phosphotransfer) domain-containing protein